MKLNLFFLSLCVSNVFGESPSKKYIVTLKSSAGFLPKTTSLLNRYFRFIPGYEEGFGVMDTFQHAIDGFLATIPESMVSTLQALPFVENIEEDADIQMYAEQKDAPWGLARMSQRKKLPAYGPFNYRYADNGGDGVAVYVIDSGVRITHEEFEGRAVIGKTFASDNDNDENGHGTHVSATIAGKTYGVAKKAQIVALKVFDSAGKGKRSNILQAMEFAMNDRRGKKGNIINMSLGSLFSFSVNLAVRTAYMNGIAVVVAAGNSGMDSILFSPSSSPVAITVGASTINDTMASFSNSGMMVDIIAPGENILSAWNGTDTDQKVISGTSMACPHISGLAAYLMSMQGLDNAQVKSKIVSLSTPDTVSGMKFMTPNRLAYNGFGY